MRVRHHGTLARIETDEAGFNKMMNAELRKEIDKAFRALGFTYVALDLRGYRTGSMNETIQVDNNL